MKKFDSKNQKLLTQFDNIEWIEESGVSPEELTDMYNDLVKNSQDLSRAVIKAKTFEMILEKSRIALDKDDIFQDKVYAGRYLLEQRWFWKMDIFKEHMPENLEEIAHTSLDECGAYWGFSDFVHNAPNTKALVQLGFAGLLQRVEEAQKRPELTPKQKDFYQSCIIVLKAMINFIKKLAQAIKPYNEENSIALENIANGAPTNIYEAMQLIIVYFTLHERVYATRIRTLGRLDVLLWPFYQNDIANGTYTKEEIREIIKFFLNKFWSAKIPSDQPFCLGGVDEDGNDITNELTYLIIDTYDELNIYSPKIHIRVSKKSPKELIKRVLDCIRRGNSSFVFVNDEVVKKSLIDIGVDERDANDYVPIGCYEPGVWGKEIACTGNGGVNLAKATELVMTRGYDFATGHFLTLDTGVPQSFEEFYDAIKAQIKFMTDRSIKLTVDIEKYYDVIFPESIMSSMDDNSMKTGVNVYSGGARYNNSSLCGYCIASLVDSVMAVKKLVYDDKKLTFEELCEVMKNNWKDNEKLRAYVRKLPQKYGNNDEKTDEVAKELAEYFADLVTNIPNGRGGVFKAALFNIDRYVAYGKKTMATPDGRYAGEPLSKNMSATIGMDRKGITGLINSVTKIDLTKFPNGAVLDIVLHPSTVQGDDGLEAFYNVIKTYMDKGGMSIHGNVFDANELKKAQQNPEKYANLQVRVCGWNAYFVKLSKVEQDCFIKQAECLC